MTSYKIYQEIDRIRDDYYEMGLESWIYYDEKEGEIEIGSLYIPNRSNRCQGLGKGIMGEIIKLADDNRLRCRLTLKDGETPINILKGFYEGLGFKEVENCMIR